MAYLPLEEMQQVSLDLPVRDAGWRASVAVRELGDRANVGLPGLVRETSKDHVLDHLPAKRPHVDLLGRGGHSLSMRAIAHPEVGRSQDRKGGLAVDQIIDII